MSVRSYSELITISTFEARFEYLKLDGLVGEETFGFDRYLNQAFYRSQEWKSIRDFVIVRDLGRDLAVEGYEIHGKIYIHHKNPIRAADSATKSRMLLDPEFLIATTHNTHNAIHYGDKNLLAIDAIQRFKNDTCPCKRG